MSGVLNSPDDAVPAGRFRMALTENNRVGRHWDVRGVTVMVYATPGQAVLQAGIGTAAYIDPSAVRELAAMLAAAADVMEGK